MFADIYVFISVCICASCMLANRYCQQTNLNFIELLWKSKHLSGLKMLLNCW